MMENRPDALYENPTDDQSIEDFIAVLQEHQLTCEHESKYVEAEMAKNRIEELKGQLAQRQIDELQLNQEQ